MKGVAEQHRDSPIRFRLVPYRPSGTLENRVRVHADFPRGVSGSEKIKERLIPETETCYCEGRSTPKTQRPLSRRTPSIQACTIRATYSSPFLCPPHSLAH